MFAIAHEANRPWRATAKAEPDSSDVSDAGLLKVIANGDRQAMRTLYMRHHAGIYRFVLRLSKNPSLAEDVVSEVFLDVWRQAGRFKGNSQVSTWLLAIARNKVLSGLRRRVDEPLDDDTAAMIEDPCDDPETVLGREDRGAIVQECLAHLSPNHREVLDLVYYHGKSVDEIAAIIGIPAGTVKTRVFYARDRLRKQLELAGIECGV
jgi:RNA polymerase sigma-70 factor (ECF subfamily)